MDKYEDPIQGFDLHIEGLYIDCCNRVYLSLYEKFKSDDGILGKQGYIEIDVWLTESLLSGKGFIKARELTISQKVNNGEDRVPFLKIKVPESGFRMRTLTIENGKAVARATLTADIESYEFI